MNKVFYIDESNTSGNKFENDQNKIIAAGAFEHDDDFIKKYRKINLTRKDGSLIKGSDLLTRENNALLEKVLHLFSNHKNLKLYFYTFSTKYILLFERTFNIFYGIEDINFDGFETLEKIRYKFIYEVMESENHELLLPNIEYEKQYEEIKKKIINIMMKRHPRLKSLLRELFNKTNYSKSNIKQNNHSDVISDLITDVLLNNHKHAPLDIEFIIDNFTHKKTKMNIIRDASLIASDKQIKPIFNFYSDDSYDGLKIADLIVSLFRKSLNVCFQMAIKIRKNSLVENDYALFEFNLKVVKVFFKITRYHIQIPIFERAILELAVEKSWKIFKYKNFNTLLKNKIDELIQRDNENMRLVLASNKFENMVINEELFEILMSDEEFMEDVFDGLNK